MQAPVPGLMASSVIPAWRVEGAAGAVGVLIPSIPTHSDSSESHFAPGHRPGTVKVPFTSVNGPGESP